MYNNEQFIVTDTQKQGSSIVHLGTLQHGTWHLGMKVTAAVNKTARAATARNHTATHLLHAALRQLLGPEVVQKGSLVAADRLRLDFSYPRALTINEIMQIEELVNTEIMQNSTVETTEMAATMALKSGAMALFSEKYDDIVRVLNIGDFSKELCGGTHVKRSGDIGFFKIITEAGVAAGIRRIEAITGNTAWRWVNNLSQDFNALCDIIKIQKDDAVTRATQQMERFKKIEKDLQKTTLQLAVLQSRTLINAVEMIDNIHYLCAEVTNIDVKTLRTMLTDVKSALATPSIIILASIYDTKVHILTSVSAELTSQIHAGQLVSLLAEQLEGKGGGRADMAQGVGVASKQITAVLATAKPWISARIL